MLERIKRITSHAGYGRFLAECDDTPFVITRQTDIPSPCAYSPVHVVFAYHGIQHVVVIETAHKRYDVFAVPSGLLQKTYVECGSCGAYHHSDYQGDCRNDAERFADVPYELIA